MIETEGLTGADTGRLYVPSSFRSFAKGLTN